jgi:hypothetical protein
VTRMVSMSGASTTYLEAERDQFGATPSKTAPNALAGDVRKRRFGSLARLVALCVVAVGTVMGVQSAQASVGSYGTAYPWSGIVNTNGAFDSVGMEMIVPRVSAVCGTASNAAVWAGLGGYGRVPFAQNGITVTPGGVGVWYELFDRTGNGPVRGVQLKNVAGAAVQPKAGDIMAVSLKFTSGYTRLSFGWSDLTNHTHAYVLIGNAARWYNGSTAEWIVEHSPATPYFASFSPIKIYRAWAEMSGRRIAAMHGAGVVLLTLQKGPDRLDSVVPSSTDESAFTTSWLRCGSRL